MAAEVNNEQSLAPAVTRASAIFDVLAESPSRKVGPSELARRLGIAKSSVANICNALVHEGLLRRDEGGYRLGHRLVELGSAYLSAVDQVEIFYEACRSRQPALSETAQLSMLGEGNSVVYLARFTGTNPIRIASDVGLQLPATHTATGKAMLATLESGELRARLGGLSALPAPTAKSITNLDDLEKDLAQVRERGFSIDDEETLVGMTCIGVTVPTHASDHRVLGLSLTMLSAQATDEYTAEAGRTARELAAAIADLSGISAL